MASMEAIEGKTDSKADQLPPISALDKIIVAFAGPLFSLLLALTFAAIVWMIGRPVGETETTTTIGYVYKGSPAEAAGLRPGDVITKIGGKPVRRWGGIGDSVMWRIVSSEGEVLPVTILRDKKEITVQTRPKVEKTEAWERKGLRQLQMEPLQTPLVAKVSKNSPAAMAHIQPNDVIRAANGVPIYNPFTLIDIVETNVDKAITLTIKRGSSELETSVLPIVPQSLATNTDVPPLEKHAMIGVGWEAGGKRDVDHPDPLSQIKDSVTQMAATIGALISRKSDIRLQHLSGPAGIIRIYWRLFENEYGWRLAIWFSVMLNVNLALLNLLPIPVLDGGHIVLALIEGVRRKPVNVRILNWIQTGCAVVIIGYMVYVTFFDAQDFSFRRQRKLEIKFAPPAQESSNPKQ